jgi:hypothetical protein
MSQRLTFCIMISGHIDITEEEFFTFYIPQIRKCMELDYRFLVGGSNGTDKMAQLYLKSANYKKVTVYDRLQEDSRYWDEFEHKGGFKSYPERDACMTKNSDGDIAFLHLNRGICSTIATNIIRRWFGDTDARKFEKVVKQNLDEEYGIGCETAKRIKQTFPKHYDKMVKIIDASFMEEFGSNSVTIPLKKSY